MPAAADRGVFAGIPAVVPFSRRRLERQVKEKGPTRFPARALAYNLNKPPETNPRTTSPRNNIPGTTPPRTDPAGGAPARRSTPERTARLPVGPARLETPAPKPHLLTGASVPFPFP